jgi:hypothetical protein
MPAFEKAYRVNCDKAGQGARLQNLRPKILEITTMHILHNRIQADFHASECGLFNLQLN